VSRFNAGVHDEAVRMKFEEFLSLSGARIVDFSVPA
jgi:hypothetical protein